MAGMALQQRPELQGLSIPQLPAPGGKDHVSWSLSKLAMKGSKRS